MTRHDMPQEKVNVSIWRITVQQTLLESRPVPYPNSEAGHDMTRHDMPQEKVNVSIWRITVQQTLLERRPLAKL
jgi:hypothetical protein